MASLNSHADLIRAWQKLLDASERSPEVQQGIETERQAVEKWLAEVRQLKARQDELNALRQQVTQELKTAVERGKEAAIQLRAIVKAKFGPRSERLVHFDVAPLRKRSRSTGLKKPRKGEAAETQPPTHAKAAE
jgi:uncharacterized protein YbbK (DUF523 family)